MALPMPTRARRAPSDEDGFILIEVLVSALILAVVAGAVLTLIATTTRSAASSRSHSTAYGLAQEDQARMRSLRLSTLKSYGHVTEPTIDGTKFFVESKAFFVNHKSGTASCTEANASADYVEITSTVSSPTMPNPVSLQSIVSPSSGSIDSTHGTLVFQVNNALGGGVAGVSIASTGSGNPGSFSGTSESTGCAIFADIPSGNYKITAAGTGLITPEGTTTFVKEQVGAPAGGTQQVAINFDKPGTLATSFVYKDPATGLLNPAPVDSMELFESENGSKTVTFGTPNLTARSATLENTVAYPFKTAYGVYAGSCTSSNPDPEGKKINAAALVSVLVPAGGHANATLQVPALNLTVTNSSGTPVQGAKVILTDTTCKYNGSNVKREFTTDKVGHLVNSKTELESSTLAVGLPFGTYSICVSAKVGSSTRRAEATGASAVTVNNLSTAVSKTLALGTSSSSECT
jgi:Tfp pilus assembly protein PilV